MARWSVRERACKSRWVSLLLSGRCSCSQSAANISVIILCNRCALRQLCRYRAKPSSSYEEFLEIRLISDMSITSLDNAIDGLYVDADFCPLRDKNGLIAFGPFSESGDDLSLPSAASVLQPDTDGHFHYRIYFPVAHRAQTATRPGQIQLPTYDLREADSVVCMRLFAPSYNLIKSRSNTIKVPASMIAQALRAEPAFSLNH